MKNTTPLLQAHHSLADWDPWFGDRFDLTADQFVSPPTSVHGEDGALCRIAGTLCLPQGRIVTWFRSPSDKYPHIWFRHQSPLGDCDYANLYYCSFVTLGRASLGKRIESVGTAIGYWYIDWPADTWFKVRLTWWILPPLIANPRMGVKLERWEAGAWVDYGDLTDDDASFEDSPVNRVGLFLRADTTYNDDYEIWGPA